MNWTGLSGTFRLKEKKKLMNSITYLISERTKQSSLLKETVTEAGYRSVDSFMRAFNKSQMLVEEYLKTQGGIENGNKSPQQTQQKKQVYLISSINMMRKRNGKVPANAGKTY